MSGLADPAVRQRRLVRLAWLSIAAALLTIALKVTAWKITGSVGLLSDAAESVVNLAAAVVALGVIHWSARPADEEHAYGHEKADYFAVGVEGALITVAAATIAVAAVERLAHPQELDAVGLGLAITLVAAAINAGVAYVLLRSGREHRAVVLEADGHHLLADVWTSLGVVLGVGAVVVTGWLWLDPVLALVVAGNIVWVGLRLLRQATGGLMDRALPAEEQQAIADILARYAGANTQFHALRTRRAGRRSFVAVHVLVPGQWTVQAGHDLVERLESEIEAAVSPATIFTHLEPLEDPVSFADTALDRDPEALRLFAPERPSGG